MKIALKITLICLVAMFTVLSANAQKKTKIALEDKIQMEVDQIVDAMDLDPKTAIKVYEVNLDRAQKIQNIQKEYKAKAKDGEDIDVDEKKARIKAVWKTCNEELKALLGKEQFKTYQAVRKELKAANKNK